MDRSNNPFTAVPLAPLTSSNSSENKRGDTGDCTAQRPRAVPVPAAVVNDNGNTGTIVNNNNRVKSNGGGTKGFYSISENLGFNTSHTTQDRDRSTTKSGCGDNLSNSYCGGDNNDNLTNGNSFRERRYIQDVNNRVDPGSYDDETKYLKKDINDDDSETEDNNYLIKSHVRAVSDYLANDPNHSAKTLNDSSSTRSRSLSTPTEHYYPSSIKTFPPYQNQSSSRTVGIPSVNLTLNLPERVETVTYGFGIKMVATGSCQQLMYRSVPPRPLSYTLTDVLEPRGSTQRSKTAPVSVNSPEEYVQRFKSRPTTRPRVIEFDGSTVSSKTKKMAIVSSGFPTCRAKIYIGHTKAAITSPRQQSHSHTARSPGFKFQLHPLEPAGRRSTSGFTPGSSRTTRTVDKTHGKAGSNYGNQTNTARTMTRSAGSSATEHGTKSIASVKPSTAQETIQSAEFSMSVPRAPTPEPEDHIHNPELLLTSNSDCDDLSILPRPKKVLPKRELPWVFRYKVKKGMNTLSRIMASKPAPNALQTNYTLT